MATQLSIIYIYYNTPEEILSSIKSVLNTIKKTEFEIVVVDNNSPKPLPKMKFKFKKIRIIVNNKNLGFGKAVNQAVKIASGNYIFILNPDTVALENSIDLLVKKIESDKKIGILGPQLIDSRGRILHSIASNPKLPDVLFALSFINKYWPTNPYSKKYWATGVDRNIEMETETLGGAALMMSKKLFLKIKGFDERFFLYFEEIDLCNRIKKLGYKVLYYPKAKIIHLVGKSSNNRKLISRHYQTSRFKYLCKYYGFIPAVIAESFLRLPSYFKRAI